MTRFGRYAFTLAVVAWCAAATAWQAPPSAIAAFDEVWQTVNDTFYNPSFGGVDWARVRAELRPRMLQAPDAAAGRAIIREMLAQLHQSHFALLVPGDSGGPKGDGTTPFEFRATTQGIVVTERWPSAPASLDVAPGDRITAVDGQPIDALAAGIDAPSARTHDLLVWRRVSDELSGGIGSLAAVTLRAPDGSERTVTVTRVAEPGSPVTFGNLSPIRARLTTDEVRTPSGRHVGVIRFNIWMATLAEPFAQAVDRFRSDDGLVIDVRGNPGGLADMIRGIAGHLLDEPGLLGRMHMRGADLEFRANPRRSTSDGRRVTPFAGPVAVLVDGLTGSASECFVGGLQSLGRVRVFGTPTMGQALPAATKRLSNGDVLMYAIGDFVTSTGIRLEGRGVVPDEVVPLDPAALAAGRTARAAALAWLDRAGSR